MRAWVAMPISPPRALELNVKPWILGLSDLPYSHSRAKGRGGGAYGEWDAQKMAAPEGCLPPSNSKGQATEQRESSFPCHVPSPVQLKVAKAPCPCSIKGLQKLERVTTADVHRTLVTAGF